LISAACVIKDFIVNFVACLSSRIWLILC